MLVSKGANKNAETHDQSQREIIRELLNEGKYFTEKKKPKKQTTQKRKKKIVGELISIIN